MNVSAAGNDAVSLADLSGRSLCLPCLLERPHFPALSPSASLPPPLLLFVRFFLHQNIHFKPRVLFAVSAQTDTAVARETADRTRGFIFFLFFFAKPAFAMQTSRPQPITTNPITFCTQHLISGEGLLRPRRTMLRFRHMRMIVCVCVLCLYVCVCLLADLQVIPRLARRHV